MKKQNLGSIPDHRNHSVTLCAGTRLFFLNPNLRDLFRSEVYKFYSFFLNFFGGGVAICLMCIAQGQSNNLKRGGEK